MPGANPVPDTIRVPEVRQTHIALTRAGFNQVEQLAVYRAARVASFVLVIAAGLVLAHFHPRWRIPALLGGAVIGYLLPGNIVTEDVVFLVEGKSIKHHSEERPQ